MSRSALLRTESPTPAQAGRSVREHEVLRVAATIPGKDAEETANAARQEALLWAERRCGGRLPSEAWRFEDFEYFSGGRNSVGVRISSDVSDIWAIRADDPDKSVARRVWTTEVVVGVMRDQQPRFSTRLLVSTPEAELGIEPATPGLVHQIADSYGLWGGPLRLCPDPWLVASKEEAETLAEMIVDQERRLPIFVLTVPDQSNDPSRPLIDAPSLARATLGTGFVAVLPADYTWELTNRLGKERSVFGGSVRAYLPGFTADADPYAHRLVHVQKLTTSDGAKQCLRWMRSLAAGESVRRARMGDEVLAFAAIRNASLESRQRRLEQEGASDSEQLAAANARIEALQKQAQDDQAELAYFDSEHKKAEERAEAAEAQARASASRLQQLLERLEAGVQEIDGSIELPDSWRDFADWCDLNLAGRLVLSPGARRQVRSPAFADVALAARCLLWLADECRRRRMEGGEGSLRDETVEDGIRNAHCGNDQFDLDWQGSRHTADWHIKSGGNTRDPSRCLRIYYFWDPATQQIVVASMPAHRRTGAS